MKYHQMQKLIKEIKNHIKLCHYEQDFFRRDYLINIKRQLNKKLQKFARDNNYKNVK